MTLTHQILAPAISNILYSAKIWFYISIICTFFFVELAKFPKSLSIYFGYCFRFESTEWLVSDLILMCLFSVTFWWYTSLFRILVGYPNIWKFISSWSMPFLNGALILTRGVTQSLPLLSCASFTVFSTSSILKDRFIIFWSRFNYKS